MMPWILIAVMAVHVLASVFWAGSTFTIARFGGEWSERLFWPLMGAATAAVASGAYLWRLLHEGGRSHAELVLGAAALSALAAALVQVVGRIVRASSRAPAPNPRTPAAANRLAAMLLALAAIGMATSRFVA